MTEDVIKEEQVNSKKVSWEAFVKQDALNFMMAHNLQAITVDDGAVKKGVIKRTRGCHGDGIVDTIQLDIVVDTPVPATPLTHTSPSPLYI